MNISTHVLQVLDGYILQTVANFIMSFVRILSSTFIIMSFNVIGFYFICCVSLGSGLSWLSPTSGFLLLEATFHCLRLHSVDVCHPFIQSPFGRLLSVFVSESFLSPVLGVLNFQIFFPYYVSQKC